MCSAKPCAMAEVKCPRCQQAISDGNHEAHIDCRRPRHLSPEVHVFLNVYCWDHDVAECAACAQSFRQAELISEPFSIGSFSCQQCRRDLTESVRAHLLSCSRIPEQLRHKVRESSGATQKLLRQSHHPVDHADVLRREIEVARAVFNATRERARRRCTE